MVAAKVQVSVVGEPQSEGAKSKKATAPRKRTAPSHPPYFEMIKFAIETLKDRTGSSQYAITKFIEDKQKSLPPNFRKLLLLQLKKLVAKGKLAKIKSSYKIPSSRSKTAAPSKKPSLAAKPKSGAMKVKRLTSLKTSAPPAKAKSAAKPSLKRKTPEKMKSVNTLAASKVAKTKTLSSPGKGVRAAPARKPPAARKAAPLKVKASVKSPKPKTVKSPAKKAAAIKKGKK